MPLWKRVANRFLTTIENLAMGRRFTECHTGYRAYSRRFLETVPFLRNSNGFVFDTEVIFQAVHFGLPVVEVPGREPLLRRRVLGRLPARASSTASARSGRRCASCCTAWGIVPCDKFRT